MAKDKKAKTAFIILRVQSDFKESVERAALAAGQSLSAFVRDILAKKL